MLCMVCHVIRVEQLLHSGTRSVILKEVPRVRIRGECIQLECYKLDIVDRFADVLSNLQ